MTSKGRSFKVRRETIGERGGGILKVCCELDQGRRVYLVITFLHGKTDRKSFARKFMPSGLHSVRLQQNSVNNCKDNFLEDKNFSHIGCWANGDYKIARRYHRLNVYDVKRRKKKKKDSPR